MRSASFNEYCTLQAKLCLAGHDRLPEEEEDAIRDAMDAPWYDMSVEEQDLARKASSELDMLTIDELRMVATRNV